MNRIVILIIFAIMMAGTVKAQSSNRHERKLARIEARNLKAQLKHERLMAQIAGDTIAQPAVSLGIGTGLFNPLFNGFYNPYYYNNGLYNRGFYNNRLYRNRPIIIKRRRTNGNNNRYNTPIRRSPRNRVSPPVRGNARKKNTITRKKVQTRARPTRTRRRKN